jgi:hypothetical protein
VLLNYDVVPSRRPSGMSTITTLLFAIRYHMCGGVVLIVRSQTWLLLVSCIPKPSTNKQVEAATYYQKLKGHDRHCKHATKQGCCCVSKFLMVLSSLCSPKQCPCSKHVTCDGVVLVVLSETMLMLVSCLLRPKRHASFLWMQCWFMSF